MAEFKDLKGKVLTEIKVVKGISDDDEIIFTCDDGEIFRLYHCQDCCENVYIEDICGDVKDLLNHPILVAAESDNNNPDETFESESSTWTFYKLATVKGWVDIRWFGSSNGYYSESVSFSKIEKEGADV